jgi:thiamine-phosphate pyrophosphorylase
VRGLYAIVDTAALRRAGLSVIPFAERVLSARPVALQLRAKQDAPRDVLALLRMLGPHCERVGTLLFANDRPDLAVLSRSDGVHVGHADLPLAEVRRFAPALRVGVSTHDETQLIAALAERPDYVAFGPVYGTASKADAEPAVGLAGLARASLLCRAARIPLVAIGGIDVERALAVRAHADLVAVIDALIPPSGLDGVAERARELSAAFSEQP